MTAASSEQQGKICMLKICSMISFLYSSNTSNLILSMVLCFKYIFPLYKLLSLYVFVGKEYHGSEDENLRKIPLLKDVFETFPNVQVNIDVKEGSDELIEQIGKLITAYNREKSTVWGSFKEDASLKCFNQVLYTIINFYFLLLPSFLEFVSYFLLEPRSRTLFLSQRCSQAVSLLLHWSPAIYFIQGNTFRNPAFYQRYQ